MSVKDIDNFIKNFVQKAIQVVVQSRLGGERVHTRCKPNAQDLFNLSIVDYKDVQDQTYRCFKSIAMLDDPQPFLTQDWNVCCEISMKNVDGESLVLEYWIFSNQTDLALNDGQQHQDKSKISQYAYQSFHRMAGMLKSLISLTRATPSYRLSSKGQSGDSYVLCYRVYPIDQAFLKTFADRQHRDSGQFSGLKTLGTVRCYRNELSMQLVFRKNLNTINNEDSAEEQRLGMINENEDACAVQDLLLPIKENHFNEEFQFRFGAPDLFEPIKPAFVDEGEDYLLEMAKTDLPFSHLLSQKEEEVETEPKSASKPITIPNNNNNLTSSKVPAKSPQQQVYSTSNESFVFVDLNCPFVSEEKVNFFNAPSPIFMMNNSDEIASAAAVSTIDDLNEISQLLAEIESTAPEIDSFVESICIEEEGDEDGQKTESRDDEVDK